MNIEVKETISNIKMRQGEGIWELAISLHQGYSEPVEHSVLPFAFCLFTLLI